MHKKLGIACFIAVGLAVTGVALLGIFVARRPASRDAGRLPDSEEAFSVPDHVGQPAYVLLDTEGRERWRAVGVVSREAIEAEILGTLP